jgi:branched-chain amino acid aminotransferase
MFWEEIMEIKITRTNKPKSKPDIDSLGFGNYFTDHMFVMDYLNGKWVNHRIVPYENLSISPANMVFHYSMSTFEGLKAYKTKSGDINLFRPMMNMERLNRSNERMALAKFDTEDAMQALKELLKIDEDWIPTKPGTSMYIRPFVIAADALLGVKPSQTFQFYIILSPVGSYYKEGMNPTKIYVEKKYVRTVKGGTGAIKTGGNYSGSILAQIEAKEKGFAQVLWLDGVERKYVEEVGTSNAFFVIGDEVLTPELTGSILPGITRDSVIALCKKMGRKMTERRITLDEVFEAHKKGTLKEAFATGTAAVISPIGLLATDEKSIVINGGEIGCLSQKLYDTLTGMQYGEIKDDLGWIVKV